MVLRLLCVVCHSLSVAGACIKDEEEKLEENSHIYDRARVLELLQEQFVHILQERPICSMGGVCSSGSITGMCVCIYHRILLLWCTRTKQLFCPWPGTCLCFCCLVYLSRAAFARHVLVLLCMLRCPPLQNEGVELKPRVMI